MDAGTMLATGRARWAVATMFFINGFVTGSWAPQIPVLLSRLEIEETVLGLLILVFGLGALVAMPTCGLLMARHGSRTVLRVFALLIAFGLPAVALAPSLWWAAPAVFFLGGSIGAMDVAMNTNAVAVERRLGRAIMSSSHGFWSLGGFVGGAAGGLAIQQAGYLAHAFATGIAALLVVAATWRFVGNGDTPSPSAGGTRFSWPKDPVIYLIGLMAFFAMIPEGAVLDWAALYLQQELQADLAVAGLAFAVFSATMAVMRFVGDRVRNRFGAVATLRVSSLVAAAGLLGAGVSDSPAVALAAFAFAGIGVANIVPIIFSAAGNRDGMASGTGMSIVTTMGYAGILAAPSAIGFVGERTGFGPVFVGMAGVLVLVGGLAGLARGANFVSQRPAEQAPAGRI